MELLELTDSLVETTCTAVSADLEKKITLKSYNRDVYTEALLKKIQLEREIEEENRENNLFIIQLALFVLVGVATIYFVVEASFA